MSGRPHPPSQMRALLQEWKRGRAVRELLPQARSIADASFAAETLFALATDPALGAQEAENAALEALRFADKVERDWRRGEALAGMGAYLAALRKTHSAVAAKVAAGLADRILQLPSKTRAEAMRAVAPYAGESELPRLMARALASDEEPLETGKAVLKAAADTGAGGAVLQAIRDSLEPGLRARMLGAWATRMAATQPEEAGRVLGEALAAIAGLEGLERLDVARAIVASCDAEEPLRHVHRWAVAQEDEPAARLLSSLGARADKLGKSALAKEWLREAERRAQAIGDEKVRAKVLANVQEGLRRAGELPGDVPAVVGGQKVRPAASPPGTKETTATTEPTAARGGRHVMALVDAYEGGLGEVHLRAVARAAPLCDAFGLDLAIVGFPVKDLASFVKRAGRETNIGEGRGSLEALHRDGRLHLVVVPENGVPDFSGLGLAVATTPKPEPGKATMEFPSGGRLCVLVGLGPKGLPDVLLRSCSVHVELTGRGVSLETATAMGVIAERMRKIS